MKYYCDCVGASLSRLANKDAELFPRIQHDSILISKKKCSLSICNVDIIYITHKY